MAELPFGEWVRQQRTKAGWSQVECADRVTDYYAEAESGLAPEDRATFSRSAWTHMERAMYRERVWPKTVLQASIGLRLSYPQCLAAAGYTTNQETEAAAVLIGRNLATSRIAAGLSVEQAALALGLPSERYLLMETGRLTPDAVQLVQLSTILGVPVNGILTGDGDGQDGVPSKDKRPAASQISMSDVARLDAKLDAILSLLEQDREQRAG